MDRDTHPPSRSPLSRRLPYLAVALAAGLYAIGQAQTASPLAAQAGFSVVPGSPWVAILLLLVFIVLNGAFVAAETAVTSLRAHHVKFLSDKQSPRANRLERLLERQHGLATACNLGSAFSRLLIMAPTMLLAPGVADKLGGWLQLEVGYALIVACGFLLFVFPVGPIALVVEQGMRTYASAHPHGAAYRMYPFVMVAAALFAVPAKLATEFARLVNVRVAQNAPPVENRTEEEIKTLVESAEEIGEIEEEERELLHSVFEFGDTVAREIMTPRVDLDAAPITSSAETILQMIRDTGHSRIPLYEESDDQIVGIIHAKDLFLAMLGESDVDLRRLLREPLFVPLSKDLHELLQDMRTNRAQMAIVQDEYGGTAGIVTIEDIVEELVGDIVDEYDFEEPELIEGGGGWEVDGKMNLDDLNAELGTSFDSEAFDTIGGLVFGAFGRQPREGESIEVDAFTFKVLKTDGRRIHRLGLAPVESREAVVE